MTITIAPRRRTLAPLAVAVLTTAALPFVAGTAEADTRGARPAASCLWAGTPYAAGKTVVAGGATYRCGSQANEPYWFGEGKTAKASTAATPGAIANPIGQFSPGARQPGTAYNDYCTGNQLIEGTDDVYQVVRIPGGGLMWKAATPISDWKFDSPKPAPTWRTASLCIDGVLT
ncbi:hypothetical protein ACFVUS_13555 [Nocardia sp. NPDC058058]|uniref:hypothetical protein n=1 Tax=Nocardia sp. NPDC058058 TaxID=3346317 RepID=UPI0036DF21CF